MKKAGEAGLEFDIQHGEHFNLLHHDVYEIARGWICSRMVKTAWFGTPCNTWSTARRGPPGGKMPCSLRSAEFVMGLPALEAKDREKVRVGNLLAARAAELQRRCQELKIPWGEENPGSSFLWQHSWRRKMEKVAEVYYVDYCSYGTVFRARTRLQISAGRRTQAFEGHLCRGRGTCTFSGRPHDRLSGPDGSTFKTARKNAYPPALCRALARLLLASASCGLAAARWRFWKP